MGCSEFIPPVLNTKICSYLSQCALVQCTVYDFPEYNSRPPVHICIKVTVTGAGLEDSADPIFVKCWHAPGIQAAFDTFALPRKHFTLPPDTDEVGNDNDDNSSSGGWQLIIALSGDDMSHELSSTDGIFHGGFQSSDNKMIDDVPVKKSRGLRGLSAKEA